ncbi:MAG TPA: IS1595 family transposase, partial [Bradyrhizobium sp.]|nr:IS1595 family transposase [Bradyrhizobium sp.]
MARLRQTLGGRSGAPLTHSSTISSIAPLNTAIPADQGVTIGREMGVRIGSDLTAERAFIRVRWPSGAPSCYRCGCDIVYDCRKANGAPRWRCKACRKDFSVTSGTIFAFHKMPLRNYLAAIAIFCNEVKGKSALALSRDLGCQYKSAFVLAHKLRESMASESRGRMVGGPG